MSGLGFIFILLPISIILFLLWISTHKKIFGFVLIGIWCGMILLWIFSVILQPFYSKKKLDTSDFYGEYIIDRNYFSGTQADWQYNNFRFEIKENNSIYFHVTNGKITIP